MSANPELSVVIPTLDEEGSVGEAISDLHRVCRGLGIHYEVLVVDGGSRDRTVELAERAGAQVFRQQRPGYGGALLDAFERARGTWVATMDSDLSHPPTVLRSLYRNRERADLLIASRFVKGGLANMPIVRRLLSLVLNRVFAIVLDMPVSDLSSGFRLYRRRLLEEVEPQGEDFSFLQDVLVKAYCAGYQVLEIPFHYFPRTSGASKARVFKFGISYLKLLRESWKLRNSLQSADWDERAYDSLFLPRRWRQRWRYKVITAWAERDGKVLDAGCGSARIFQALPDGVGLDLDRRPLRYRRTLGNPLVCAHAKRIPLASGHFDQVICAHLIEQAPRDDRIFHEFHRVLRPGGTLVVATPDAGRPFWRLVLRTWERLEPGRVTRAPVTRYTLQSLRQALSRSGFEVVDHRSGWLGDLAVLACKREA